MEGQPYAHRLSELEQRFGEVGSGIESPEQDPLSALHGLVQEVWRSLAPTGQRAGASTGLAIEDIASMHQVAPKMDGGAMGEALPVGAPAPDFKLRDANNQAVSLSDFRGSPVVLIFYPLDWSPTCSDQLSQYQSELPEFERYGAKLVGISVDSIYSHGAWAAVRGINYPMLADFEAKGEVARHYNVWRPGDGFSERALFVIDGQGIVRYAHVSPRLAHIPDICELFTALTRITGKPEPASNARRTRTDRCREVRQSGPRPSLRSAIGAGTSGGLWHTLVRGRPDGAPLSRAAWIPYVDADMETSQYAASRVR